MVFRQKPGHAFKVRVSNKARTKAVILSTKTHDADQAEEVSAFVKRLRDRKKWPVLDALVAKTLTLSDAFDADVAGELDELMAELATVDLSPLVEEWKAQGANAKYVIQVRVMIPEGTPYPAARFTRKAVSRFLATLDVQGPTKNRYRTALSQFARWLIEQEHIETNVVRDVRGKPENDPRSVWYEWSDAKRIIEALEEPYKSIEALMAGTGMEWQAIANLKRRDIDLKARTVRAHGHKNRHRNRMVRITEEWVLPIITRHCQSLTPNATVFNVNHDRAIDRHAEAVAALHLEASTLHDWRHTYAVNWLRKGGRVPALRRQLGHAPNSTIAERVYAQWVVEESDYDLPAVRVAK